MGLERFARQVTLVAIGIHENTPQKSKSVTITRKIVRVSRIKSKSHTVF